MNANMWLLASPLLVLQIALQIYALVDVVKRRTTRPQNMTFVWVAVIVLLNMLGPILYFVLAKRDQDLDE